MGNTLTSPKGGPLFTNNPTQTATDMNALRIFVEKMGNHRADTGANRTGAGGADIFDGLIWEDTTDGLTYKYTGGSWVVWTTPLTTGTVVARTNFSVNALTRLSRRNGFVTLNFFLTKTAGGNFANSDILADLPVGYRPIGQVYSSCLVYSGVTPAAAGFFITTAGAFTVVIPSSTGTDLVGSITFPAA